MRIGQIEFHLLIFPDRFQSLKVFQKRLFRIQLMTVIENPDRPVVVAFGHDPNHFPFVGSFADPQDLRLCSRVHAIQVEAEQIRFEQGKRLRPVLDLSMSVMKVVDDANLLVAEGS